MHSDPNRWEHGSEFHWPAFQPAAEATRHPWDKQARFFGSGRDALRSVLDWGRQGRSWRRAWVPSYFCQEVVAAIRASGLAVATYGDGPDRQPAARLDLPFAAGDVLLLVNHFGLRRPADLDHLDRRVVDVIEDHTHDPWSAWAFASVADFAVASLRKTLPLPDGGVVWSPCGWPLPPQPPVSDARQRASRSKLAGMLLKGLYLRGHAVGKQRYRKLLSAGESEIAAGECSGMTEESRALVDLFPVDAWRSVRRNNHQYLGERLAEAPGIRVLQAAEPGSCPFSAVLVCDTPKRRQFVRQRLIDRCIYPAILWPLEEAAGAELSDEDRRLSLRLLSLHCDMRYGPSDLDRVAAVLEADNETSGFVLAGADQYGNCPISR